MKLSARERNLWLTVLVVTVGLLGYRFWSSRTESTAPAAAPDITLAEARRILHAAPNILARHQASVSRLAQLKRCYIKGDTVEQIRINLLQMVEDMASSSELMVERKNIVNYPDGMVGVVLEGTSSSGPLFRFMYQIATARVGFHLKKIQMISNPAERVLKYQLIVVTQLMNDKGD